MKASPTLYPGQTLRARLIGSIGNTKPVEARLFIRHFSTDNALVVLQGSVVKITRENAVELQWTLPRIGGQPIAEVGIELVTAPTSEGIVYLDSLGWDGEPDVVLERPAEGGDMWEQAWTDATDGNRRELAPHRVVQNSGRGMIMQGTREWRDYEVSVSMKIHMAKAAGLSARVQGLMRYYALLIKPAINTLSLVKMMDGVETELASCPMDFAIERFYTLALRCCGPTIIASLDGKQAFEVKDTELSCGAIGLVAEEGHATSSAVTIRPATR